LEVIDKLDKTSSKSEPVSIEKPKPDEKKAESAPVPTPTGAKTFEIKPIVEPTSHGVFLGVVYANDLARGEINKENPQFPAGSIIVREKFRFHVNRPPEVVIAMVKREKNFSPKTGDWEFFVFDGKEFDLKQRETVGSCSACHAQAEKTDWVFRDYLK
jgi:hypothetical protein